MPSKFGTERLRSRDVLYRVILGGIAVGLTLLLVDRYSSYLRTLAQTQALLQEVAAPLGYQWQGVIDDVAAATRATATIQLLVVLLVTAVAYALCLHVLSLEEVLAASGLVARRAADWSRRARSSVNRAYITLFAWWFAALAFIVLVDRHYARAKERLVIAATTDCFEAVVTQTSLTHLFRMTGDVLWLTPVALLVFIGFLHLRRVTALLRARAEVQAPGGRGVQPAE